MNVEDLKYPKEYIWYMHNGDNRNLRLLFFLDKDYNYVFFSAFIEHDKKEYNKNIEKSIERLIK